MIELRLLVPVVVLLGELPPLVDEVGLTSPAASSNVWVVITTSTCMRFIAGLLVAGLAGCGQNEQPDTRPAERGQGAATVAAPDQSRAPAPLETPVTTVVMDVMQVVGKTEAEVAGLLGQPVSCADIHRARLCKYGPHEDEVMFVRDKADMITVQGMDKVAFSADALDALGLAPARPDHADELTIRWESIPELVEVAVFPGAGNSVGFAYVKVGKH